VTDLAERPKGEATVPRYTEAEIERALVELAAQSGNTTKTALLLAEDDLPIDQKTLWRWKTGKHAERYERIRHDLAPQITAQATEAHMALARQQMALSQEAAQLVAGRLPHMEDKDLINAMGKADIGSGIHTEKAQLLAGQPTHIVQKTSKELIRELEAEGLKLDAIDVEVIEEETLESGSQAVAVGAKA
jgi:hypothetical protein